MAFNRDHRSGRGRDSKRGSFGGDREMFQTICSKCGKECEVPFRPTGSKPVFCIDCFRNMGGNDSRRNNDRDERRPNFDNRNREPERPQYKEQLDAINSKLDTILKLLNPEMPVKTVQETAKLPVEVITSIIEPIKKKVKVKKPAPTKNIVEPAAAVENPSTTDVPTENPVE